jgi:hypothetical protein
MDDGKSIMDEKDTNYWPTLLLLLLWIGLPERLQMSYLPPIRVKTKSLNPISKLLSSSCVETWKGTLGGELGEQMDE